MSSPDSSLGNALRRFFRLENRRAAVRAGRRERISELGRELTVYLPPGYDDRTDRRYPVLFMHDGQNLFDSERAFIPGQHWRLQEAADAAIGERCALPMIIVGVDHAGPGRIDEYTPTRDPKHPRSGRAAEYAKELIEKIKPLIDERYRTIAEDTAVGGSSLGGLVSLYLALTHPEIFRRAAVMSPSVWWNDRAILKDIESFSGLRPRMWVDIGGREGVEALADARLLRERLKGRGWTDENLRYYEDRRGDHSERTWARRARQALEFLFPPA